MENKIMYNYDLQCMAESFGKAKRTHKGWMSLCPAHDDSSPSLSLSMDGDKLLAHCFAGCSFEDIVGELVDSGYWQHDKIFENEDYAAQQTEENKIEYANKIWSESRPAQGTLVEAYLRSRGYTGKIPDSIRYYPSLKHTPSGNYFPAMIAAVTLFPSYEIVAIHRTYLKSDGTVKADVEPNKMMIGRAKGGAVMFGEREGMLLHVAEGIETALSIFLATGLPTLAALSASNMSNICLPSVQDVPFLFIDADNDEAGIKAAIKLGDREDAVGRTVMVAITDTADSDFNDLLRRK
jgi:putative DNA primase/helicase